MAAVRKPDHPVPPRGAKYDRVGGLKQRVGEAARTPGKEVRMLDDTLEYQRLERKRHCEARERQAEQVFEAIMEQDSNIKVVLANAEDIPDITRTRRGKAKKAEAMQSMPEYLLGKADVWVAAGVILAGTMWLFA